MIGIYDINDKGLTVNTKLLFPFIGNNLKIKIVAFESSNRMLTIYYNKTSLDFFKVKKFLLDSIPLVKTVVLETNNEHLKKIQIHFLDKTIFI